MPAQGGSVLKTHLLEATLGSESPEFRPPKKRDDDHGFASGMQWHTCLPFCVQYLVRLWSQQRSTYGQCLSNGHALYFPLDPTEVFPLVALQQP